jgi:hypothetical protein
MSPSNALNAINQDNMSVLKNEAVNVARLVWNSRSWGHIFRENPLAT